MRPATTGAPAAVKLRNMEAVNKVKIFPIQAIRNSNSNSGYSNHILSRGHKYGSITGTMNMIKTEKKGKHLNTCKLEIYHI
jgi:hypothetical protein